MSKKKGWVASISRDGWAKVITERGDACNNCEAAEFCHSIADCSKMETRVLNMAGAKAGDLVTMELSSKMVLIGAFVLYIVPVIGLLSGAIIGSGLSQNLIIGETDAMIASAFAGLVLGFIITASISRWFMSKNKLTPVITRVIDREAGTHG